ncbi:hypothetical protein [Actinomyces timonensis]|uniref:hypothetical protein n=1 Tax=Actinomyces timonensis TaxID=1288391 RepID=UPI0005B860F9|nr:hypothetical protein [Actinomyces timonensis]
MSRSSALAPLGALLLALGMSACGGDAAVSPTTPSASDAQTTASAGTTDSASTAPAAPASQGAKASDAAGTSGATAAPSAAPGGRTASRPIRSPRTEAARPPRPGGLGIMAGFPRDGPAPSSSVGRAAGSPRTP